MLLLYLFSLFPPLFPSVLTPLPPPLSLSLLSLSCPGSWNTLFPPSDSTSCWLALPFHAVFFFMCKTAVVFFSRGGCQRYTTWFLPMTNPLYVTQRHRDRGSYVGWWRGTRRKMTMHKILFMSSLIVYLFLCGWLAGPEGSWLCVDKLQKGQRLSGSLKAADCN